MGLIDIRDGCPSPADPTDRVRALISALDDDDIKRGEAVLSGLAKAYRSDDVELLLAFDRQCEDPGEPSWKVLIRSASIASRVGLYRLSERALEWTSTRRIGLPAVYENAAQLSLDCARLDLAAIFLRRLRDGFPDHPATDRMAVRFADARRLFARIAALDDGVEDEEVGSKRPLADPAIDLGAALLAAGRPAEALEACLPLATDGSADPAAWTQVGDAYYRLGQFQMAARSYGRVPVAKGGTSAVERLGDAHLADGNPHVAIRCYGHCSYENTHDIRVRGKLAQATGRVWRDRLRTPPWHRDGPPRYFDCFMFNGEFDLAVMRFTELWDHVEKFIVVEAAETFTGSPKPLMFRENIDRFADFRDKIVHVPVETFPASCQHPWAKDFYQRDAMLRGLDGLAAEDDYVVIADADEIWRWDVLSRFEGEMATLRMRMSKYFLNYQAVATGRANRDTAAISRYRNVRLHGANAVRFNLSRRQRKQEGIWLDDAGWHFHALGDERFIQYKFSSYAHREHHKKRDLVEVDRVRASLDRLRSGDTEEGWAAVPARQFMPACVQRSPATYERLLLPTDAAVLSDWIRRIPDNR